MGGRTNNRSGIGRRRRRRRARARVCCTATRDGGSYMGVQGTSGRRWSGKTISHRHEDQRPEAAPRETDRTRNRTTPVSWVYLVHQISRRMNTEKHT